MGRIELMTDRELRSEIHRKRLILIAMKSGESDPDEIAELEAVIQIMEEERERR
jgi:hypothetical protein